VNDKAETIASRKASQNALNGLGPLLPEFLGGSADLAGSNLTIWSGSRGVSNTVSDGNYIYYGVREFAMSAIMNGITLHGGFTPYGATFLMFSEYARNALRMAALMKIHSIFVYTHDSIGLGEDGPTHQPVEQTATLRMIPNMSVWRPCDAVESAVCWKLAVERKNGPSCLIFSRQNLAHQNRSAEQIANIERGGYILRDCEGTPDVLVIATGSEVDLAVQAAAQSNRKVRVVSMPSTDVFDAQDEAYRESVLPSSVAARVAVEAGVTAFWSRYVGLRGKVIGIDTFGESAPAGDLFKHFGFTVENVVAAIDAVG
jgi:transketolase